jgi:hypothetical protein
LSFKLNISIAKKSTWRTLLILVVLHTLIFVFISALGYVDKTKGEQLIVQVITFIWISVFGAILVYLVYLLLWYFFGKEELYLDSEHSYFKSSLFALKRKRRLGEIDNFIIEPNPHDLSIGSIIRFIMSDRKLQIQTKHDKFQFGGGLNNHEANELIGKHHEMKKTFANRAGRPAPP